LRQLPGVDEAGGDEIPGRIDEVVEVAGDDGTVTQVDSNEMVSWSSRKKQTTAGSSGWMSARTGILAGRPAAL
jgi:hypothetical protein